jgi:hypothetical protein
VRLLSNHLRQRVFGLPGCERWLQPGWGLKGVTGNSEVSF